MEKEEEEKRPVSAERDLLHPLATLHWERCHKWECEEGVVFTHCAVLHDTVVVLDRDDILHISTDLHSWTITSPPYHSSSLTTYQSNFVLVGGYHPSSHEPTNQLWTSTTGLDWDPSLLAMPTKRYSTSSVSGGSPEVLVVAGGMDSGNNVLDVVEVLHHDHWTTATSLPTPCFRMRSTFHEGNFYFTGGHDQENILYTCSCDSLTDRTTTQLVWRKMTTPDYTYAIASYSSRLIRIDRYSTLTSYSTTTQKWVELTSVGDVPHDVSYYVILTILSTGQLVIANYIGVFRGTLSVSTFDLDTKFISNVLSRLEAVMGVKIESELATMVDSLTSTTVVMLQPCNDKYLTMVPSDSQTHRDDAYTYMVPLYPQTHRDDAYTYMVPLYLQTHRDDTYIKILPPDPQRHPVQCVQEVIIQWSMGHSPRPPTWRELLQVIQDMGLLELRQQIQAFMKGEASYLEAYNHFIRTKESLSLLFLKFLFVGPPRLGKTTLRRRLLKEIIDLISAGEADKSQPSTGAVESSDVVVTGVSSTTAVITESEESEWSKLAGLADEARMLVHSLMSTVKNTCPSSTPSSIPPSTPSQLDNVPTRDQSRSTSSESSHSSPPVTGETQQLPVTVPSSGTSSSQQEARLPQHISKASSILREAMGSDHWKNIQHMFKAYMRMEDTGGQPELMDMLPALTLGPGLYLLFINLQNDLNHHYKLTYCNASGESTSLVESVYSVKEMLLSSLSSISCSNASAAASKLSTPGLENTLELSKSVAYIVGTHRDKVSNEQVKKINKDLKQVIMPTEFYKQDVVQFASKEDLIVAMDNMAGGAEEVEKMKKLLEGTMARHFKKLKIPAVWLFFSLFLRHHDKRTVSLDYCMELSSTLGMSAHETEVALWFLHHHAGVLMYFPNVPELKDLVIIDVQVVYDSVTVLIIQAMSYEKVGHSAAEGFKKTGKFTKSRIMAATREVCGDHIPIDKLVALLEFLHIIARIHGDQSSSSNSSSQDEITYMMPCVLSYATREELDSITKEFHEVPIMLFHFTCGAVPIGLFPALMSALITTKPFTLIQEELYKNIVKFRYGCWRTLVVVSCYSTFYQISILTCTENVKLHEECDSIRKKIMSIFPLVTSRFNYGSLVDYQLAFDCPIHPDCNRQHLCVIDRDEDLPQMMDCLENANKPRPVKMCDRQKQWFGQILMTVSSSTQEQDKSSQASSDKGYPLNLKTLTLLKRKREDGCTEKLRIIQEVCPEWEKMGALMGISASHLKAIHMNAGGVVDKCCRDVFNCWLEKEVEGEYPVTWQGLCELLDDMEHSQLIEDLKQYICS